MTKSSKKLWARLLFQDRGILPTGRLLVIFLVFSIPVVLLTFAGVSWTWVATVDGFFFLFSLLDLFFSPKKKELAFKRTFPEKMERGLPYSVKIEVRNSSSYPCALRIIDGLPQTFKAPFPMEGMVEKQETANLSYETIAPVRGRYQLSKLYVRYRSSFGLWEKQLTSEVNDPVKVIPDLSEMKQYLEDAQRYLMMEGLKIRKRKSGEGEFAKIRSFVIGDDPRKINWRQTAKLQEIMTNEYEPEHGKTITVLIDCGRMMGAELEKGNRLEKALEAAMTVCAAALHNGDYVSVLAFSKEIKRYVPPAKGIDHLQKILESIYDLEVDAEESNYPGVLHDVQNLQRKRSLLLLFSDVHTFLHEESGLLYLKRLRKRHLFLMIGIEDRTLTERAIQEPETVFRTMVKSMAQQQLQIKKKRKANWERQGMLMVEAKEERLASTAVSHYIQIINQGLL